MKQAFLICAHKDIDQLNGLVRQLCDPDFRVYVHLDRKSALDPAQLQLNEFGSRRLGVHRARFLLEVTAAVADTLFYVATNNSGPSCT